ncbi:hypothetical protein AXG55_09980 [Silvanigrella aquatica]|uniref:2-oxoadipate dioxygenase/decarboxylase n=1 Tax=Silvanigrella aquatica TaxID=1915309 RepID=A0A1L4D4L4_9BACT|nr:hypothetical protein AXG55_09980 [Silvanigrella aquatica]
MDKVIKNLWQIYRNKVSQVKIIEEAIRNQGDEWSEDHIAFRTLPGKYCDMSVMQQVFELLGYTKCDEYVFKDKKLNAISMNPPVENGVHSTKVFPKVFISVLELSSFSVEFQNCLLNYVCDVQSAPLEKFRTDFQNLKGNPAKMNEFAESITLFLSSGAPWRKPIFDDYEVLRKESEYAAWTLVYGNTPNHFTVSIHLMKKFKSLKEFNDFVQNNLKISLNSAGGSIIKGTPSVKLEQSATLAEESLVPFQDGYKKIPYAFVEFAFRHPLEGKSHNGIWENYYQGFVTDNADKIFESTNIRN